MRHILVNDSSVFFLTHMPVSPVIRVACPFTFPVLEGYFPFIGDEQDPVIGYGLLTFRCPDRQVVRLQADILAGYP